MAQIKPPEHFSFNSTDWIDWYADWEQYLILSELERKTDAVKISALLYTMGTRKAQKIMRTFRYGKKRVEENENPGQYQ